MLTAFDLARGRRLNDRPLAPGAAYVLYWMVAARRTSYNHALERAIDYARKLSKPLLVFEPLRAGHRYANARSHQFVIDGMADNRRRCERAGIGYFGYVEPRPGEGSGLLERLAADACCVVTDDTPLYFLPRMLAAAGAKLSVQLEAVDSCGLLPIRAAKRSFESTRGFRRHIHDYISEHLLNFPLADPLARARLKPCPPLAAEVLQRWDVQVPLGQVQIDHRVAPVESRGGERAARETLQRFLAQRVDRYHVPRADLEDEASSGLSPYLHFGHMSPYEVVRAITEGAGWSPAKLVPGAAGLAEGYWGLPTGPEGFLDQVVTWRELGFNTAVLSPGVSETFESLPAWAARTLEQHASDPRPVCHARDELESAATYDALWNAAQTQLVREGRIHPQLRPFWGKKIIEWTASPREALDVMFELNDRWALDGRDPNSVSGIFWTLGRYDRPHFPERPIFGCVRQITSESLSRKFETAGYLARFAPPSRA